MKTPILIAGWATGPSTSAVNYLPGLASPSSNTSVAWFSTLANAQTPVAAAGSFKNLVVRVPTALTQGSYTVTLVLNGVDQALSVVINTVSGQTVADSTHSISVAAGDKIALKITPSGTPTSQAQIQFGIVFETTGGNGALFAHCQGANVSGTNVFTAPGCYSSNGQTTSTQRTAVMPCAGSISVLYANLSAAPGTGLNRTVTLVKNGVDQTALTISDSATDGSVTFGTAVSYAIGDTLTIRCGTTTTTAAHIKISTDWTPTNANEVPVFGLWSSVPGTSATAFSPLNGTAIGTEATETNTENIAPIAFTITAFRADIGTAPGNGKSRAFTVRQNAANSATTVTISGNASTTASWSGTLSIAADDLLAVSEVPSGTPSAAGNAKVSAVIKAAATTNVSIGGAIAIFSAQSDIQTYSRSIPGISMIAASINHSASHPRSVSGTVISFTAIVASKAFPRAIAAVAALFGHSVTAATFVHSVSGPVAVQNSFAKVVSAGRVVTGVIATRAVIASQSTFRRAVGASVVLFGSAARLATFNRGVSGSVIAAPSISMTRLAMRALSGVVALFAGSTRVTSFTRAISGSAAIKPAQTQVAAHARAVGGAVTGFASTVTQARHPRAVATAVITAANVTVGKASARTLSGAVFVTASLARSKSKAMTVFGQIVSTANLARSAAINRTLVGAVAVQGVLIKGLNLGRGIGGALAIFGGAAANATVNVLISSAIRLLAFIGTGAPKQFVPHGPVIKITREGLPFRRASRENWTSKF